MSGYQSGSVEFVITAPEPYGAMLAERTRSRMTLGALVQLIAGARTRVVIAAPFLQQGAGLARGILADAMLAALRRGVDADIVSTGAGLQTLPIARWRQESANHLRLYQPRTNIDNPSQLGSHAKFCIADGEHAYVGSANLTGPGLSAHLEMGLLVSGEVAHQIDAFWRYTIDIGLFVQIPNPIQ